MSNHIMLDLEGLEVSPEERELLQHPQVGGVILFSRNYIDPEQLGRLVRQIREASAPRYLLIAVDQEGGRVQRFREGFTRLPPAVSYGQQPSGGLAEAQQAGYVMASELRSHDIDISFAPVLDLGGELSEVIGDRAFHSEPQRAAELAEAFCVGMHRAGMATIGKHFPGHGSVIGDSHTEIPVDNRPSAELAARDLIPFKHLIHSPKAPLDGIMPAHVIYSAADSKPAGFSSHWLQTVLRGELGFQGAIFSDDLTMEGASAVGNAADAAKLALAAGCDMLLVCNQRQTTIQVIESLGAYNNPLSQQRLMRLRGKSVL